jgi:carbon monoxide dehydrogenase subunit G
VHLLVEESVDIQCPVEAAYAYTCDLRNFGQWFPGVIEIVAKDDLELTAIGKSYLETVSVPLRGKRGVRIVVKEASPDSLFVTQGSFRPLLPRMEIRFSSLGPASSRVNWRMYSLSRSALVRAVLIPLASRVMNGRAKKAMKSLRFVLEAQRAA